MARGPQKADYRTNFYITPHMLVESVAWRHLSNRGRSVLSVLQTKHNGWNNGKIGMTIHELSAALGNQNHGANSRALAEVIEKGFAECMSDANRHLSLAREYRLTFVSTGKGKDVRAATNEYLEWRPAPGSRRKFGGARTATESRLSMTVTATRRKVSVADTAMPMTESRGVSTSPCIAVTAPHIVNHPRGNSQSGNVQSFLVEPDELRSWAIAVIEHLGQRRPTKARSRR